MAKLKLKRLQGVIVFGLLVFAMGNIIENVYSAIPAVLTGEEQEIQREERYASLGACPAPEPEALEVPVEDVQKEYFDAQACVSDTSVASAIKSTNKAMKELRSAGGVKKPFEPEEKPSSSPCSTSDKKALAEQARYGAQTEGLAEGKDGAETMANQPGSTAEYALISQNMQNCHEQTLAEMVKLGLLLIYIVKKILNFVLKVQVTGLPLLRLCRRKLVLGILLHFI